MPTSTISSAAAASGSPAPTCASATAASTTTWASSRYGRTHRTVLVSDGGAVFGSAPDGGLLARIGRYVDVVDHQALALRKRWLISNFLGGTMTGAYWGIGSATGSYAARRRRATRRGSPPR